jgi:hypothetical protein
VEWIAGVVASFQSSVIRKHFDDRTWALDCVSASPLSSRKSCSSLQFISTLSRVPEIYGIWVNASTVCRCGAELHSPGRMRAPSPTSLFINTVVVTQFDERIRPSVISEEWCWTGSTNDKGLTITDGFPEDYFLAPCGEAAGMRVGHAQVFVRIHRSVIDADFVVKVRAG